MSRASPQIRRLAKQLQAFEKPGDSSAEMDNPPVFRVIDKLRPHLSLLMGQTGLQALLARALVLATAELTWLREVRVVADGELEGLTVAYTASSATDFSEGEVVMLAQLLGLLVAFIGPALTLRLINQIWPQMSVDDTDLSDKAKNEKAR